MRESITNIVDKLDQYSQVQHTNEIPMSPEVERDLRACVTWRDCSISFKKKDGSDRTLLTSSKIPDDKLPKDKKPVSFEPAPILYVFEKPTQMWKSIRVDSIYAWKIVVTDA